MKRITCRANWYTVPKDKGKICAQMLKDSQIHLQVLTKKSQTAIVILMPTFKTCSVLKPTSCLFLSSLTQ